MSIRSSINHFFEWVTVLAWINLLWVVFTLLGLIVFGWAPATVAMLNVFKKVYREKNLHFPIFSTFLEQYKVSFFKANATGIILFLVIIAMAYGLLTLPYLNAVAFNMLFIFYLIMFSLVTFVVLFIFPILTHYRLSFINSFKYSMLIGLSNLHYSLVILISMGLIYVLFRAFPGLILFFAVSIPSAILMKLALKVFDKVEIQTELTNKIGSQY